jgi:hypothetical protein
MLRSGRTVDTLFNEIEILRYAEKNILKNSSKNDSKDLKWSVRPERSLFEA